jgi:hypothetical protein
MRIADTVSYGNYFALPATGRYRIDLQIRVPGRAEAGRVGPLRPRAAVSNPIRVPSRNGLLRQFGT